MKQGLREEIFKKVVIKTRQDKPKPQSILRKSWIMKLQGLEPMKKWWKPLWAQNKYFIAWGHSLLNSQQALWVCCSDDRVKL